jgi:alkane 1-monooxygenase
MTLLAALHFWQLCQLLHGYPASMLMALVPPLWFGVMNPKIKKMEEM